MYFFLLYFTILYWFCHTSTWICHRCTRVPNPEPPSHLPPPTISLGHPSAPAPSILYPASNLDWRFVSYMILYMFQCHSPKSSRPLPLPQSPKVCSTHIRCISDSNDIMVELHVNDLWQCHRKGDLKFFKFCWIVYFKGWISWDMNYISSFLNCKKM